MADSPIVVASARTSPGNADVASQTARAFVRVREMLLRGEVARGERISELPLVARLGMSRTPIRLALERLMHAGLLETNPTGGFTVREFTLDPRKSHPKPSGSADALVGALPLTFPPREVKAMLEESLRTGQQLLVHVAGYPAAKAMLISTGKTM